MPKIRLGVIGVGGMGGAHLNAAAALTEDFSILAVCDANAAVLKQAAEKHDAESHADFRELCERGDLDAVLMTLPHVLYKDAALAALDNGLHIFKEKPVGRDLADAAAIRRKARETGKRVMLAGQQKYAHATLLAKEMVDAGVIGDVFMTTGVITYRWGGAVSGNWGWRGIFAQSGGVAVIDSGWHSLDLMHWLRGMPSKVYATTGTMKAAPGTDYDVDDKACLTLDYPDGGIGSMVVTYLAQPGNRQIVLYGTKGTLDMTGNRLHHWDGDTLDDIPVENRDVILEQMRHFAQWIRGEVAPMSDIERGIEIQRIVQAAYQSAATGAPVLLSPVLLSEGGRV